MDVETMDMLILILEGKLEIPMDETLFRDFEAVLQVDLLTVGVLGQVPRDLYIDALIAADSDKVDLFGAVFADINVPTAPLQLKTDDVFHHRRDGLGAVSEQAVLERGVIQIIVFAEILKKLM